MIEKIYISIVIVLLVVLFVCLFIAWKSDTQSLEEYDRKINLIKLGLSDQKTLNYRAFVNELRNDLRTHNISTEDKDALNKLANKIMFEEIAGQKSMFKKVVGACFYGLMQGGATGFITGGLPGALGGSIVFGTINPIMTTYKELNPVDEQLI
jgi:hypothetical protein